MSGVFGVVGMREATLPGATTEPMTRGLVSRGHDLSRVWTEDGAALGVVRNNWELGPDFSGEILTLEDQDLIVAADASLYYHAQLEEKLARAGVVATGNTPSHYIAAAYRAWGSHAAAELEGDFAFVVWDRTQRLLCCARDFAGKRPLFYAQFGGVFVVASTVRSVLAHPACPGDLNPAHLGAVASGLLSTAGLETDYAAVHRVLAARTMVWSAGRVTEEVNWQPPPMDSSRATPFDVGAEHLEQLLTDAVTERMARTGDTSVWLSGGWDSTAVWGVANAVMGNGSDRALHPVSISYPPGDPGREDELIAASAEFWNGQVRWLDIGQIPLFDEPARRAAARDESFAHMFEMWIRALANGSSASDTRIAFDGFGGDQLFQVSDIYMADLLRQGSWRTLAREWQTKGGGGLRQFLAGVVEPHLPWAVRRGLAGMRGKQAQRSYLERVPAPWVRKDFLRRHGLLERDRELLPGLAGSLADTETTFYLTCQHFYLVGSHVSAFALESGVESRSPLFDRRIVEFALTRPRAERARGRETKRLLRRAMTDLVPDSVLAPRPRRTGITSGYSQRGMSMIFPELVESLYEQPIILAELGVIDADLYRRIATSKAALADGSLRPLLFLTLNTELWLRGRRECSKPPREHVDVGALNDHGAAHHDFQRPRGSWTAPGQPPGLINRRPCVSEASPGTVRNVPRAH